MSFSRSIGASSRLHRLAVQRCGSGYEDRPFDYVLVRGTGFTPEFLIYLRIRPMRVG